MNGFDIGELVYSALSSTFDCDIYPIVAPLETKFPYIVYKRDNLNDYFTKDREWEAIVSIICVSDKYEESIEVVKKVYQTLKDADFDFKIESSDEDWADNAYVQTLNIKIIIN